MHPDTVARREKIVLLADEGRSATEIAAVLGITARSVLRHLDDLGRPQNRAHPWTAHELGLAAALLADGCSYAEVGRTLGCPYSVVQHRFPGRGGHGNPLGNGRHMRLAEELGLGLRD